MQTDEYARLYEHEDRYWWFVGRRKLALELLSRALKPGVRPRLLDLGCGTGAALAEMGGSGEAFGIDLSPLALGYCRQRGLSCLVLANGERIPLRSNAFDGMIALDIFEHIADDRAAFAEAYRALRPGGVLVLSVPAFRWLWGPHDVALMHRRRYTLAEVRRRLTDVGFRLDRLSYSVFLLFPAVVLVRLLDKFRRGPARVSLPEVPRWLNALLERVQMAETWWIARAALPWGSSVVAVARKPSSSTASGPIA